MSPSPNKEALLQYCLYLADNSLILGHRLSEWCGHGPILEEDIALANISLDLIGQSRLFYSYAAEVEGLNKSEDDYAYFRDARQFRNALLCEIPNGHFGTSILRQLLFSQYACLLFEKLSQSTDTKLAAIASKSLKECLYHLRHSSEWTIRLGCGTEESHSKMLEAIEAVWRYHKDLFADDHFEKEMKSSGIAPLSSSLYNEWVEKIKIVFDLASLAFPDQTFNVIGGRDGKHTEHLGYILADMQFVQRAYPGGEW
ncbi:MAG TPA: phenylacetate-CoA oxygenase subunit PaaC [Bacteroidia bacterium]|nr:phenylacetate-CoA oxygenase subunit PaaC [Bacteroidia bacterium]HNT79726.1 phenylacetate-CoA oxygenase subunit PaaC [Bacteroidia bacterium]